MKHYTAILPQSLTSWGNEVAHVVDLVEPPPASMVFRSEEFPGILETPDLQFGDISVQGAIAPSRKDLSSNLKVIARSSTELGQYGNFIWDAYFRRVATNQERESASAISYIKRGDYSSFGLKYCGEKADNGRDATPLLDAMEKSGFPIAKENGHYVHTGSGVLKVGWFTIRCDLDEITEASVDQLEFLLSQVSEGPVFEYGWRASIVDEEMARAHGWDLIKAVQRAELPFDRLQISLRCILKNWEALDSFRSFGEPDYEEWLRFGNLSFKGKKGRVFIRALPREYRVLFEFKTELSPDEIRELEVKLKLDTPLVAH
jgi:hypothetical protein